MRNPDSGAKALGQKAAVVCTAIYVAAIIGAATAIENNSVYYALLGAPVFFPLVYCLCYTLKTGILSFLPPERIRRAYDNPVDGYFRSEHEKDIGCVTLCILLFLPTLVFFFLFSWIWYLKKA